MRLLIAGGGTGGHIYPALAVARSLRARAGAPELGWLGGHRGLEAALVPPAGHPAAPARSCAPSGRRAATSTSCSTRSGSACPIPQALVLLLARRPAAIFTTGGYVAIPTLLAAVGAPDPERAVGGQRGPGPQRRASSRALATVLAVSHAETAAALGHPTRVRHRDADPVARRASTSTRRARRSAAGRASGSCSCSAARRPCAGSTTPCSRRCRGSWSGCGSSTSPGDAGYAAALAAREALPEDAPRPLPAAPVPARRHDRGARGGGPRRRPRRRLDPRRGRGVRAADGDRPVPARRRPPAAQRGARSPRPAPAILIEDEDLDADRLRRGRGPARRSRRATPRCRPPRATSPGPDAADAVADLVLAVAHREPLPDARPRSRRSRAGPPRDRRRRRPVAGRPFDAARHRARTSSAGSASRPSRDEPLGRFTTMRVGGPADLFAVAHNAVRAARPRRASRARARSPVPVSGAGATS